MSVQCVHAEESNGITTKVVTLRYLKKAIILTTMRRKRIRTKEEENEEEEDEAGRLTQLTLIATSSAILRCVN